MCTEIDSIGAALRAARQAVEFLNSPAAAGTDGAGCGEVLTELAGIRDKLAAASATFLRRFDAADAHRGDGYPTASSWLAGQCRMTHKAARAQAKQMRVFAARPVLHEAVAAGDLSESWAAGIAEWTRKLPEDLRAETDKILVAAAQAGADLRDLATIAGFAIERWRQQRPDRDRDGFDPADRHLSVHATFGGAGVIRGDLSPECAAAVTAVLEALGKRRGPEDDRSQGQRQHDALHEAFDLLLAARLLPDRAGAPTQAVVHVPISGLRGMPGAGELEDEWLRARLGESVPGYLDGQAARAAACDAQTVPVVTGRADMGVIDKLIGLAHATCCGEHCQAAGTARGGLSLEAWQAHRYAIARLAIDFVSGPGGIASVLRTGLLQPPFSTPSLPLDIGVSATIPGYLRRAVILRDGGHCAFPTPGGCDRPAAASDIHHVIHQEDGGPTALWNLKMYCKFHHLITIHRDGWQVILLPDGTCEARSPDGRQILRTNAPP
jgi:hypothetical protein